MSSSISEGDRDKAIANYRKAIHEKRKNLNAIKQHYSSLADIEHDEFKRSVEDRLSQYASIMEDMFTNIETMIMLNTSLQFRLEGLRDIVLELEEVKNNPAIQEKIRSIFIKYQSLF